jgi:mercuric ion transport protein
MAEHIKSDDKSTRWGFVGIIIGAIGASICCIGPLILLALGISGAWVGTLSAFETYRPFFMAFTLLLLGFAHYRVYKTSKAETCCDTDEACQTTGRKNFMKTTLWIVTVVAIGLMAFPYLSPSLAGNSKMAIPTNSTERVELTVHNMTCGGCAITVQKTLSAVDGVVQAKVDFDTKKAVVVYNPQKVKPEDLTKAAANMGYPADVVRN